MSIAENQKLRHHKTYGNLFYIFLVRLVVELAQPLRDLVSPGDVMNMFQSRVLISWSRCPPRPRLSPCCGTQRTLAPVLTRISRMAASHSGLDMMMMMGCLKC